jgi:hypothetical protein
MRGGSVWLERGLREPALHIMGADNSMYGDDIMSALRQMSLSCNLGTKHAASCWLNCKSFCVQSPPPPRPHLSRT